MCCWNLWNLLGVSECCIGESHKYSVFFTASGGPAFPAGSFSPVFSGQGNLAAFFPMFTAIAAEAQLCLYTSAQALGAFCKLLWEEGVATTASSYFKRILLGVQFLLDVAKRYATFWLQTILSTVCLCGILLLSRLWALQKRLSCFFCNALFSS